MEMGVFDLRGVNEARLGRRYRLSKSINIRTLYDLHRSIGGSTFYSRIKAVVQRPSASEREVAHQVI